MLDGPLAVIDSASGKRPTAVSLFLVCRDVAMFTGHGSSVAFAAGFDGAADDGGAVSPACLVGGVAGADQGPPRLLQLRRSARPATAGP
uniref:Uncharacterized protein n=1 Tax=Streptomyces sp. F2 TaxID=317660 RepID=V9Z5J2_9ACTN|nr:hypothetical protein pFRL4_125c [Streptomyces sp. F2]